MIKFNVGELVKLKCIKYQEFSGFNESYIIDDIRGSKRIMVSLEQTIWHYERKSIKDFKTAVILNFEARDKINKEDYYKCLVGNEKLIISNANMEKI